MRIHLDTDFAGDTDDAAALVMLLGLPEVEIVGITTVADEDGRRAGYVRRVLDLAGRGGIPVAVGAGRSSTTGGPMGDLPRHGRYRDEPPVVPLRRRPGMALDLLTASVEAGAVLVGIGPFTNLAALELARPGSLSSTQVTVMGGWVRPPVVGLPQWGPEMDWNVQCDTRAALTVFETAADSLTLVTLPATLRAHLRGAHLPRLEASGPLGRLLAHQARAHAEDRRMGELAAGHPDLPADLLNLQYDAATCVTAANPSAVTTIERLHLQPRFEDAVLSFEEAPSGKAVAVVTAVDGQAFEGIWLTAIERAE